LAFILKLEKTLLVWFPKQLEKGEAVVFEEIGLIGDVLVLIASLIVLDLTSDLTITNSVALADVTGFGRTATGFILVALCTSLSALSVSFFSAVGLQTIDVAIGNALGSNIANIGLGLGICFLLAALRKIDHLKLIPSMTKEEVESLYFGLFIASLIPLALIYIGYSSRVIGIILVAIFLVYTVWFSRSRIVNGEGASSREPKKIRRRLILTFLGAAGVVLSSFFFISSASNIAISLGILAITVGSTVVAFGTSVPVLVVSIGLVRKGHLDIAIGNIVGNCFMDTTLILGIPLLASPLNFAVVAAFSTLVVFSVITSLFLWYFLSSERISWKEGALLAVLYALFLIISFNGHRS
jgi:cation:H+ antiporter